MLKWQIYIAQRMIDIVISSPSGDRFLLHEMPFDQRQGLKDEIAGICGMIIENTGTGLVIKMGDSHFKPETPNNTNITAINTNLSAWMTSRGPVPRLVECRINTELPGIVERMGINLGRLLYLVKNVRHLTLTQTGKLNLSMKADTVEASYARGIATWQNGNIVLKKTTLPLSVRIALAGLPVAQLIDDPIIGPLVIRAVSHGDKQAVLTSVTTTGRGKTIAYRQAV